MTTTAVYRIFDARDRLLYVGQTANPGKRYTDHARLKDWWEEIALITVVWYPTLDEALAREQTAIENEKPVWNVLHNRRKEQMQEVIREGRSPGGRALVRLVRAYGLHNPRRKSHEGATAPQASLPGMPISS